MAQLMCMLFATWADLWTHAWTLVLQTATRRPHTRPRYLFLSQTWLKPLITCIENSDTLIQALQSQSGWVFLVGFHPTRMAVGFQILLVEDPFLHTARRALPGSPLPGSCCFVWILVLSLFFTPQKIKDNTNNIKTPF